MTMFKRSNEVNSTLASICRSIGWLTLANDTFVLFNHFNRLYGGADWRIRGGASILMSLLILMVEFAATTVLFDHETMIGFIGSAKNATGVTKVSNWVAIGVIGLFAAFAFHYNYIVVFNSFQLPARLRVKEQYHFLAIISVILSEILFWISNLLDGNKSGGNKKLL